MVIAYIGLVYGGKVPNPSCLIPSIQIYMYVCVTHLIRYMYLNCFIISLMLPGHHAVPFLAGNTYYCMIFYVMAWHQMGIHRRTPHHHHHHHWRTPHHHHLRTPHHHWRTNWQNSIDSSNSLIVCTLLQYMCCSNLNV